MSNPTTQRTDTLEVWRTNLNTIGSNVGDPIGIYVADGSDIFTHPLSSILIAAINDLNSRKVKRSGDTITSLTVTNGLTVAGTATFGALTATTSAQNDNSTHVATTAFVFGQAAVATPLPDTTAGSVGIALNWAREDHTHPLVTNQSTSTSLATSVNPVFSGIVGLTTNSSVAISDIQVVTTTTTSVAANQTLASFPSTTYRSAEFIIQAVDSTGSKFHSATVKCVNDGSAAYGTEYASISGANGICAIFSVDMSAGNMRLLCTPTSVNSTVYKITAILTKS
jgi:hypothetical protein